MKVRILPPARPELACPRCLSTELRRSARHHAGHTILEILGIERFRCLACYERFLWLPESWSISGAIFQVLGKVMGLTRRPLPPVLPPVAERIRPAPTSSARR